ncbi:hypothetical protein X777_01033 [Ooceraea biroi]|uniref:GIY-YIG domain-containing protein n=1 Tax=Ooceraea biroi TaxID=2015173 RepID=A0A026WSB4_OOCBI|nr:hypothetical protein X777_01033 [Ooceraea biroi]
MDCEACYIGQTKRHLNTRIREHQLDITKKARKISGSQPSRFFLWGYCKEVIYKHFPKMSMM